MKLNLRSLCLGLGQVLVVFTLLISVGCQSPVGSSSAADPTAKAAAAVSACAPNVAYATGAQVTYNGVTYTCLQGHTSMTGWEPPNVPALWKAGAAATPLPTPTPAASPTPTPKATPNASTASATWTPST